MNQSTPIQQILNSSKQNKEDFDQLKVRPNVEGTKEKFNEVIEKSEEIRKDVKDSMNKISINMPIIEDIDTKTLKFGLILLIVLTMMQNKQGQSTIIENLPDGFKSTELITNISVACVTIIIIFLFYKLLN
tara:strand:- start:636 stop:1028 length:393 start_codon:yes stop_codon:yes gene_type:complete